jgi:hypothetical protein
MAELSNSAVERLLLLMSNYGQMASRAMLDVSPDPELVTNASLVVPVQPRPRRAAAPRGCCRS